VGNAQRVAVLRKLGLLDTPGEEAFDRLTRFAARRLNVPIALVNLIEDDRQFFKSAVGMGELRELPIHVGVCSRALEAGMPLVIEDARKDPAIASNPIVTDYGLVSYIGHPLSTSTGHGLGTFCVVDTEPREWREQDLLTVKHLAYAAMVEIEMREEAVEQEKEAAAPAVSYSMTDVPENLHELKRQVAWNTHACLSIIEDLEAVADWDENGRSGELVRALLVNVFTLSHSLWPGGKRQSDELVAPLAAAIRPLFDLESDSPLNSGRLEGLGRALNLDAAAIEEAFDSGSFILQVNGEQHRLAPLIDEVRRLWATIADTTERVSEPPEELQRV
jgi:hypothetical protein